MEKPEIVYVTYIAATPERVWQALTSAEFTGRYWFGRRVESDWRVGSPVRYLADDGRLSDSGEILECDPPRKLSFTWRVEFVEELRREGFSRVTFTLEPMDGTVKLTLVHDRLQPGSKVLEGASGGWVMILSSLKSMLETGKPLPITSAEAAKAAEEEATREAKR
jgi:uncharacterized protein YndB with AHSA1/START domain